MPVFNLNAQDTIFPPAHLAAPDGLLAVGGDLSSERLIAAYSRGIFPWFNPDEPMLWWSPNPRFVMVPNRLKVSKSMKQILRKGIFQISFDQDFLGVIRACKAIYRPGQRGTWISDEIIRAYYQLFKEGFAHSTRSVVRGATCRRAVWLTTRKVLFWRIHVY